MFIIAIFTPAWSQQEVVTVNSLIMCILPEIMAMYAFITILISAQHNVL